MKIGQQIKYWRKKRGFTQSQLAEALGLSGKGTIYDIESGRRAPGSDTLQRISEILNCDLVMVDKESREEAG